MEAVEREIVQCLAGLRPDQKRQVLEYVRALADGPLRGVPGKSLLRFRDAIPLEDLRLMAEAVDEDCGKVEHDPSSARL